MVLLKAVHGTVKVNKCTELPYFPTQLEVTPVSVTGCN